MDERILSREEIKNLPTAELIERMYALSEELKKRAAELDAKDKRRKAKRPVEPPTR